MRKVIGIDVDLTIVDTLTPWLEWYKEKTGEKINIDDIEYNVEKIMEKCDNPLKFWKREDLYDNLQPIEEAKKYIDILSNHFDIVFISSTFGEHYKSKERFIERHFPYADFIATHTKKYIDVDYFIDDHKKYIDEVYEYAKSRGRKVFCYRLKTMLNKSGLEWKEIFEDIKEREHL